MSEVPLYQVRGSLSNDWERAKERLCSRSFRSFFSKAHNLMQARQSPKVDKVFWELLAKCERPWGGGGNAACGDILSVVWVAVLLGFAVYWEISVACAIAATVCPLGPDGVSGRRLVETDERGVPGSRSLRFLGTACGTLLAGRRSWPTPGRFTARCASRRTPSTST